MAEYKVVVPESVLKKIKREEEWALAKKQEAEAAKKKSVETRKLIFKRAEQYAKEYAEKVLKNHTLCCLISLSKMCFSCLNDVFVCLGQ